MGSYTLTITWSLVAGTVNNPQKMSGATIAIQYLHESRDLRRQSDTKALHEILGAHMGRFMRICEI